MNGSEFCKKAMHEAGVAIVPGTAFGKTCQDYVRFSLPHLEITYSKHWKI
jgi:aspartate/methionine/tyrosine aminotransferase